MQNPTKVTVNSPVPVDAYVANLVLGPAEQLLKSTTIAGPFPAGATELDLFGSGIVPANVPFDAQLALRVASVRGAQTSQFTLSNDFSFHLAAPSVVVE